MVAFSGLVEQPAPQIAAIAAQITPPSQLFGFAESRFAGPACGCPRVFGLVAALTTTSVAIIRQASNNRQQVSFSILDSLAVTHPTGKRRT
jgi:hypothetical protein